MAYLDPETADSVKVAAGAQAELCAAFRASIFRVWEDSARVAGKADAAWGFERYGNQPTFGGNRMPLSKAWFDGLEANAGLETYPNASWCGVTLNRSSLRVLPAETPVFLDFRLPGEGFPFDYGQQSAVPAGLPVAVRHRTADGGWLFVDTPTASGWIQTPVVAAADWAFQWQWETGDIAVVLSDGVPVSTEEGRFLFSASFGSVLPMLRSDRSGVHVLAPVADGSGNALAVEAVIPSGSAASWPLPITDSDLARAVNTLLGDAYGWGGLYGDRDCSALMKDLFAPFGIFLPRNSAEQAAAGDSSEDLSGLPPSEKERALCDRGIPFLTLVHLPGHIMLYLGCRNGRPVVFHSLWGVRTRSFWGREGRHLVGRAVITTLSPGRELRNADESAEILKRVDRMTFLVNRSALTAHCLNRGR
jgi:hypothetical protein